MIRLNIRNIIELKELYKYVSDETAKSNSAPNCLFITLKYIYETFNKNGSLIFRLDGLDIHQYNADSFYNYTWNQFKVKKLGIVNYK